MTVITGKDGEVIGTLRRRQGLPASEVQSSIHPLAGQETCEIDVPDHFLHIEDATHLHREVAEHLRRAK